MPKIESSSALTNYLLNILADLRSCANEESNAEIMKSVLLRARTCLRSSFPPAWVREALTYIQNSNLVHEMRSLYQQIEGLVEESSAKSVCQP